MRKYFLLFVLCVSFLSCSKPDEGSNIAFVEFVVKSENNSSAKITTLFLESGFFKHQDTFTVNTYPFSKKYQGQQINFSANLLLKYKDNNTNISSQYKVTLQAFSNSSLIKEQVFTINKAGDEVSLSAFLNK